MKHLITTLILCWFCTVPAVTAQTITPDDFKGLPAGWQGLPPQLLEEIQKLTASDAAAGDEFGWSVSISGDTVIVGARLDDNAGSDSGSAYVLERNQGGVDNWGEVTKITASDAAAGDQFGISVSISGDTVVVGAHENDDAGSNSGSAYVFERNLGGVDNWGEVKKLTASDAAGNDFFSFSVSISGDTVVVGAQQDDDAGSDSGSTYVFERNLGGLDNWGEVKKLTASDAAAGDGFGESVSISADTVVVGAFGDDSAGSQSGSAYVFERNQGGLGNWGEVKKLTASDAAAGNRFSWSVSISGDTVAVGAVWDDDAGTWSGSAYIFERDQGGADNWGEVKKLTASDAAAGDQFGSSVSISGGTVVVGAYYDDDAGSNSGSAYIFVTSGPNLTIPSNIPTSSDLPVLVPITFTGSDIAATTFSVDFDETCLDFDPADGNGDGVPDAVTFTVPGDFISSVTFAAADVTGELDFVIADFSAPLVSLPDGIVATMTFTPICTPVGTSIVAPVTFGLTPAPSFGDTQGNDVPGVAVNGSVEILPGTSGGCLEDDFSADEVASTWTRVGVGNANQVSADTIDDGSERSLALTADGATAYYGADNAGFLYQELTGDFRFEATIDTTTMTTGKAWRKAGLMARASLDHLDIRLLAMLAPIQQRLQFVAREVYGNPGNIKLADEITEVPLVARFAIERVDQTLSVQYSLDDGVTWITPDNNERHGSIEIASLPETLYVGMAVVSNNISVTSTALFDDVSICLTP